MIIDIVGFVGSGKTTSIVKMLDPNKLTIIHNRDGDFGSVYKRVTGRDIFDDYDDRLKLTGGEIVEYDNGVWLGKVQDSLMDNFINGVYEVLVLDITLPKPYVDKLKVKFKDPAYRNKTVIFTHNQMIGR